MEGLRVNKAGKVGYYIFYDNHKAYVSTGNLKLKGKVLVWNLPAVKTCPGSSNFCRKICYARKPERMYRKVVECRMRNFSFSKEDYFPDVMINAIRIILRKIPLEIARIHESGDFYSKEYFEKWVEIASELPHLKFYAYTKSLHLIDYNLLPENFNVLQSVETRHKDLIDWDKPTARIVMSKEDVKPWEFFCDMDNEKSCMLKCKYCLRKDAHVVFLLH